MNFENIFNITAGSVRQTGLYRYQTTGKQRRADTAKFYFSQAEGGRAGRAVSVVGLRCAQTEGECAELGYFC